MDETLQWLHPVQAWSARRLEILRQCTDQTVSALDCSDARLAAVRRARRGDARWDTCAAAADPGADAEVRLVGGTGTCGPYYRERLRPCDPCGAVPVRS